MRCPRWLVALAVAVPCTASEPRTVRFRDVASDVGLKFHHVNGASERRHLPEIMGAGGAFFDYDLDGDLDVFLVQGRALEPDRSVRPGGPRLYRNDLVKAGRSGSRLEFTDVTGAAGFAQGDLGMGVAAGDYDNDGRPDLYLTNVGPNRLYRNLGGGAFEDVTAQAGAGLNEPRWSTSASFADYDADGDLDLFVANYVDYSAADNKVCSDPTGGRDYCGPLQFRPAPDRLFRNDGTGRFTDVTDLAGLSSGDGAGLGVVGADLDGDRQMDFYVANDATANQLWTQRDGRFADTSLIAGAALNADGQPEGSMGIAAGDSDNDGDLDLFVTNITGESHAFYVNGGGGMFEDRRLRSGLGAATRPFTGFGTEWFDYDHDGLLDLFVANGAVTVLEALRGEPFPFHQPNQLLHNVGGGRFRDVSAHAGPGLQLSETSRGAAFGDVDNDGDIDVLLTNNGGPVRLLLNEMPQPHSWLQVRLEGVEDNRHGLGARVALLTHDGRRLWRRARTDGSYLSSSDPRVHFGLQDAGDIASVLVEWPRGMRELWTGVALNRMLTLRQGSGSAQRQQSLSAPGRATGTR